MFNSLKYVKKLEEAGVSREQAEMHIQIVGEIMETNLATRQDLKDLNLLLTHEIALFRQETTQSMVSFRQEIAQSMVLFHQEITQSMALLRQDVKQEMAQSEQRMTIKLGTIVSIAIGIAVTLAKIVH